MAPTARALGGWLGPAYGGELRLAADLDAVEALSPEREALWARLESASFLTDDEKRAAVGYGAKREGADQVKFNPNHDDLGRFDFAPGGGGGDDGESGFEPTAGKPGGKHPSRGRNKPAAEKPTKPDKPSKPSKSPAQTAPTDPPKSLNDVLLPGGKEVGARHPGAGENIRTVTPTEFSRIESEILNGAKPITSNPRYGGQLYERADGTIVGVRQSDTGPVIEVHHSTNPNLKPGFKVHRK